MSPDMRALMHSYFDETLSAEQEVELNTWLKASAENAEVFVELARLHDCMRGTFGAVQGSRPLQGSPNHTAPPLDRKPTFRSKKLTFWGGVAVLATGVLVAVWSSFPTPVNAATELARLIDTSSNARDRTYQIRNLDGKPEQSEDRRPPIDNAALYVRHDDKYVLVRRFPDGRPFITGSDGERSWSIPPEGVVRVSENPMRFRGPVPGHQHGIPFVNLRSDLVQLRDAYFVSVIKGQWNGWRGLLAEKKSPEHRGPRRVELWYDARTGVIHRMVFNGMPQARGGPNSVAVELQEERDLKVDFFRHESHHGPERRVIEED